VRRLRSNTPWQRGVYPQAERELEMEGPSQLPSVPPLLRTKLHVPRVRPGCVPRPRLIERLNEGLHRKLTLVSAPAGFGKKTLVSAWLSAGRCPAAWVSLDPGDNDPIRFLRHMIAALQTVAPGVGGATRGLFWELVFRQVTPIPICGHAVGRFVSGQLEEVHP
jgi:hypothetical protein